MPNIIRVGGGGASLNVLTVAVESGAVVTARSGTKVVTATSVEGIAVLKLQSGTWALVATKDGQTAEDSIIILDEYPVDVSFGLPLSDLAVGSLIKTNFAGAERNFLTVHQGLPSSMYDASCDGTWVLINDIYEAVQWHSSRSNIYKSSTIHSRLNGTILGLFDSNVQDLIKQVKIPYVNGTGSGGSVASGANGLDAKIFLLSMYECGWTQSDNRYFPIDGSCLSYFNGLSSVDSKRIGYLNGTATHWWTRSPVTNSTEYVWRVIINGGFNGLLYSTDAYGNRFSFILPSDAMVNPTPNADGSYTLIA